MDCQFLLMNIMNISYVIMLIKVHGLHILKNPK